MTPATRSTYVHAALHHIPNRFSLCRYAAKAARAIHVPGERMEDSTNQALARVRRCGDGA